MPTFCAAPYRPMQPAIKTGRYESVSSVVSGNRIEEKIAKREKDRSPKDWTMSGSVMLDTIPRTPNRAAWCHERVS